jgi:hypothetical protein
LVASRSLRVLDRHRVRLQIQRRTDVTDGRPLDRMPVKRY